MSSSLLEPYPQHYKTALSDQHLALSTQHSALSTQAAALRAESVADHLLWLVRFALPGMKIETAQQKK
jgi:hypothetical protein